MSWRLLRRLHAWVHLRSIEQGLDDELREHREAKERELAASGLRGSDLEAAVRRAMGNETSAREAAREVWFPPRLEGLMQDLRYASRSLRRTPAFSVSVVVLLALGVGCSLAAFSLVDRVFFRAPSGVVEPSGLRRVWYTRPATVTRPEFARASMPYLRARAIADALGPLGSAVVYVREDREQVVLPRLEEVAVSYVDRPWFAMLGVRLDGSWPPSDSAAGDESPPIAVVSATYARTRFPEVESPVGRHVRIGDTSFLITGVAPPAFTGLDLEPSDIWIPLAHYDGPSWFRGNWRSAPNLQESRVVVRLDPERSLEAEAIGTIAVRRAFEGTEWAAIARDDTVSRATLAPLALARGPGERRAEFSIASRLLVVTLLVTLITCANVASLMIARMMARRRELATRLAIGISASRLHRSMVLEPALLVILAAALALVASRWTAALLESLLVPDVDFAQGPLGWRTLMVAASAAALIVAGIGIAIRLAIRPAAMTPLLAGRGGPPPSGRAHRVLLATQTALSVTVLAGALAIIGSLHRVRSIDVGWDTERLISVQRVFRSASPPASVLASRLEELTERVRILPGVEGVTRVAVPPLGGIRFDQLYWGSDSITSMGRQSPSFVVVDDEYFAVSGISLVRGRTPLPGERTMVVNSAMASLMWRGEDPIGACVNLKRADNPCHRVVGIVQNATQADVIEEPAPVYYLHHVDAPSPAAMNNLLVRAHPDVHAALRRTLEQELRAMTLGDAYRVTTGRDAFAPKYRRWRIGAMFFAFFAALALLVAGAGMYANVAYLVHGRRHELAIRSALGARPLDLLRTIVGAHQRWIMIGGLAGIAAWTLGAHLADALMYQVSSRDPRIAASAIAVTLVTLILSSLGPAGRGALTNAARVLRED